MASIVKRNTTKGNSYFVVYNFDRKQIWKHAGYRRIDANRLKAKIENDIHSGVHRELPEIGLQDFAVKWIEAKRADVRPKTLTCYEAHIKHRIALYFGNRPLKTINAEQIEHFKAFLMIEKGISPATTGKHLLTLKMMLKTAVIWGYIGSNPAEYIKKPLHRKPEVDFLTIEEIKQLVEVTSGGHQALIATAAYTGMRQGELLGLMWDDVDFEKGRIQVKRTIQQGVFYDPKSETSKRSIDIPQRLCRILKEREFRQVIEGVSNDLNLVFPNETGKPIDPGNLHRRIFKPALKVAGLRTGIKFHSLRHSYASILINQGANIKYVQKQLGHSNIQQTLNTYSHLLPDAGREAIDQLDSMLLIEHKEIPVG